MPRFSILRVAKAKAAEVIGRRHLNRYAVSMRLAGLVVLVVAIGFVALLADEEFHVRVTFRAMDHAGYGEQVIKRARRSHCPLGEASFVFLSQGGRLKHETTGYVCTGYFGTASIHDGPLHPDEGLDWD